MENMPKHRKYIATIVGVADPNVGIGGFLTGGDIHSLLGSNYGLGVDNSHEIRCIHHHT